MEPPFMGEKGIVVQDVRDIDIHSSRFYDLAYVLEDDPSRQVHVCRIGPEAVAGRPGSGDMLRADFAMGQVIRLRPR